MGEYAPCTMRIGGTLPASKAADFVSLLNDEGWTIDDGNFTLAEGIEPLDDDDLILIHHYEARYGRMEALERFCVENQLPFDVFTDGVIGLWPPHIRKWRPDLPNCPLTTDGDFFYPGFYTPADSDSEVPVIRSCDIEAIEERIKKTVETGGHLSLIDAIKQEMLLHIPLPTPFTIKENA